MRIGIDARAWGWTGIGRYTRNLVRELAAQTPRGAVQLTVFVPPAHVATCAQLGVQHVVAVRASYYSWYEQTGLLRALRRERLDLLHFPHFNVPLGYRRPFVVTIHDLTRFRFPGARHRDPFHQWAYQLVFRAAVTRARAIIAVSDTTARELAARFPSVRGALRVIAEGVEEQFRPAQGADEEARDRALLARRGVRPPYLLYVGLWLQHKNLPGLLRTFRLLRRSGYHGALVITGEGRPWDEDVRGLATAEGVSDRVILPGQVPEELLPALYRQADLFLFPSFLEGFGLPPLEAMACGTPVVAARAGSLPEVLGDAALFGDPHNPAQLADAARLLLSDRELRGRLVALGRARVSRFRWGVCARETLAMYHTVFAGAQVVAR